MGLRREDKRPPVIRGKRVVEIDLTKAMGLRLCWAAAGVKVKNTTWK